MSVLELPDQRVAALERANGVRSAHARWKAEMAELSERDAARVAARILRDDPTAAGALSIYAFLTALPNLGDAKARGLLTTGWYIWPFKKVRELTERQRCLLADELERTAWQLSTRDKEILGWLAGGSCLAGDIADGVGLCPRSMGSALRSLHHRGLIERDGGRLVRLQPWVLTALGREVVLQMRSRLAA